MDGRVPTDRETHQDVEPQRLPLAVRLVHDDASLLRTALIVGVVCASISLGSCVIAYQLAGLSADGDIGALLVMYGIPVLLPVVIAPLLTLHLLRMGRTLHQRTRQLEVEVERRREAEAKLAKLATIDDLTQVVNRRAFFAQAAEIAQSGEAACVAVIDLDNFKQLNDAHGHAAGDQALRDFGEMLSRTVTHGDVIGRLGGEEFGVIMRNEVSCDGALARAERVRLGTMALDQHLTASIGLTDWGAPDDTIDAALARADAALYRAKQRGRNRVELIRRGDPSATLSDLSPLARR